MTPKTVSIENANFTPIEWAQLILQIINTELPIILQIIGIFGSASVPANVGGVASKPVVIRINC